VTKIDACLSSVAVYQMSMRLLHKSNIEQMDKSIRSFFGLEVLIKRNTTLSNGSAYVNPRKKVDWVLKMNWNFFFRR
jgi:hypothetical protein